jgi:oxygen-dependent protoporphyrinogen oxidase
VTVDVIVVGGGIAGLSVAYELGRRHVPFLLLERAARPGGVILSEQIDGFTVDGGPDSLLVQKRDGIALCEELGLGPRLIPTNEPRLAYVQRGGRLHALPPASVFGIPTRVRPFLEFTWAGKLRMAGELFVPPRRDDGDESIGSFITRRFGGEATTYLAEPLLAGIHAGDVDRLSMRSLFPRLVEAERRHGSLLRAFRRRVKEPVPNEGAFRSLPGGLSEMVRALRAALPSESVRLNAAVRRILRATNGSPRYVLDAAGREIACQAVVFSTPAYVTGALVGELDAGLGRLCGEIPYASTATIALAYRRSQVRHPLNGSGFVVPRVEGTGILAASWMSSKWAHRAPPDHVLMRAFAGGARDPDALNRSDAELVELSRTALDPLLGLSGEPLFARVYRWERTSAQHEVGHLARLEAVERALARLPGLFVTGSGFRGVGIPDCVADGRATGRQVAEYLNDAHKASA